MYYHEIKPILSHMTDEQIVDFLWYQQTSLPRDARDATYEEFVDDWFDLALDNDESLTLVLLRDLAESCAEYSILGDLENFIALTKIKI